MSYRSRRLPAALLLLGCAVAELPAGPDGADTTADDTGSDASCTTDGCFRTCFSLGRPGGACAGTDCVCDSPDALPDVPPDVVTDSSPEDASSDVPSDAGCDPAICDSACRSIGWPGGACDGADCRCTGGADADADTDVADARDDAPDVPVDDGSPDDVAVDDGPRDDGAVDDAPIDDVPIDDGSVDDVPIDDGGADDAGGPWGTPVCDPAGGTLPDRGIFGSATSVSRTVTVPPIGVGRVVRLDIVVNQRRFLGIALPFDDLEATLTSPTGTARRFWFHFDGDGSGMIPDYQFHTPWDLPVWWDQSAAGTWTLALRDVAWTGSSTTVASWCVTPLDPALHAATDTSAHLSACDTTAHAITDYCSGDPPDPCDEHPVKFEIQVPDLVRAATGPSLMLVVSHTDVSQLQIDLVAADGSETRVWNRGAGPIPASIPLPGLAGAWMTGRYSITVTDKVEGASGQLRRWCVEAN